MSPGLRRHVTTIALSVLALGGAVVLFVVERGSVTTDEAEARKKNLLEAFRRDDVSELSVTAKGRTARVFREAPSASANGQRPWQVEIGGRRYAADEATVDQYLGSLEFAVFERRVPAGSVDRAALGLERPRIAIALTMGSRTAKVAVGGPAPSPEGASYAEADGRGAVVLTAQLATALELDPELFRERKLMPYTPAELVTLELEGKGGSRTFERAPWGGSRGPGFRWSSRSPERGVRVNAPALDRVLGALGSLEAEVFLTDEEADRALSKEVTITMVSNFADSTNCVIEVGGVCPGYDDLVVAIQRSPSRISACVPDSVLPALSTPAEALVDRRLIGAAVDTVIEVKLVSGDRTLDLARKGTAWRMRSPSERAVEAELGRSFLESLLNVEASRVVPGAGAGAGAGAGTGAGASAPVDTASLGLSPPRATVRVVSSTEASSLDGGPSDDRVETLEIGAEAGDIVHVRRLEDGALLEVPADRAASFFPSESSLRSREVINEPSKRFLALRVWSGDRVQRLRRGDEGWELVEPKASGLLADTSLVNELAERMGSLSAERWATAKSEASFGLEKPRIVIEADIGDEGEDEGEREGEGGGAADAGASARRKTLKLLLGAPATEGSFASLSGDGAVFVAPKELERAADRWLLDREALRVDPASIARVALAAESGKKMVAERSGEVWRITSGEGGAARAAAIRDALADFVAEEAVSIGKPKKHEGLDKPILTIDIERSPAADAPPSEAKPKPVRIVIGAGDVWRGTRVYYARRAGVDATFAVAQSKVRPLLEAAGVR